MQKLRNPSQIVNGVVGVARRANRDEVLKGLVISQSLGHLLLDSPFERGDEKRKGLVNVVLGVLVEAKRQRHICIACGRRAPLRNGRARHGRQRRILQRILAKRHADVVFRW